MSKKVIWQLANKMDTLGFGRFGDPRRQQLGLCLAQSRASTEQKEQDKELLKRVRQAGPEVLELKGNTCYAIATCIERMCEAILRNEHSVLTVSARLNGEYGIDDVCLGTPCVIGDKGILKVLKLPLDETEGKNLAKSAQVLRDAFQETAAH